MKIVIIDDETLVRKGIMSMDWESHRMEIVGDAADGESGLELVRKVKPDVVLTDIRMPVMDGLSMIRIIRKEFPQIKIIILSVLDDFNSVREALRMKVTDYVNKFLMDPDELLRTLLKIRDSQYKNDVIQPQLSVARNQPVRLSNKLLSWLEGQDIREFSELVNEETVYMIGIIDLNSYKINSEIHFDEQKRLIANWFGQSSAAHIRNAKLGRGNNNQILFLITAKERELTVKSIVDQLKSLYQDNTIDGLNAIGISEAFHSIQNRETALQQANLSLEEGFFETVTAVHVFNPKMNKARKGSFLLHDQLKYYMDCLEGSDNNQASEAFNLLFPERIEDRVSSVVVKNEVCLWVSRVISLLKEWGGNMEKIMDDASPYNQISQISSYKDLRRWCSDFHNVARETMLILKSSQHRIEIQEVLDYVNDNYMNHIQISDVAALVCLSENYFSYMFSKEMGEPFVNYLQKVRIEKAKELLRSSPMHWADVGEQVGFRNAKYFTKIFKKYTNLTPSQYRC